MAMFTAVSIPAIIPFLYILFDQAPMVTEKPEVTSIDSAIVYAQYLFSNSLEANGQSKTLVYQHYYQRPQYRTGKAHHTHGWCGVCDSHENPFPLVMALNSHRNVFT